jgi:hypothetical protein
LAELLPQLDQGRIILLPDQITQNGQAAFVHGGNLTARVGFGPDRTRGLVAFPKPPGEIQADRKPPRQATEGTLFI